jgi:DNA-binding transcriptional MerR regulator
VRTALTIDQLATATGTTTRSIRSFQSLGLLEPPELRGRTGLYDHRHVERIGVILHLQAEGFSLRSLAVLFAAQARGDSLSDILGVGRQPSRARTARSDDSAELYGFAELQPGTTSRRAGRRLLSVVPTTLWQETQAS